MAPKLEASAAPPNARIVPTLLNVTQVPNWGCRLVLPAPTSFDPCCIQVAPPSLLAKIHTAPVFEASLDPPIANKVPAPFRDTAVPCDPVVVPTPPEPRNLLPCCTHVTPPSLDTKTHTEPNPEASFGAPTTNIEPASLSAIAAPCAPLPVAPVPTNLLPCCVHVVPLRLKIHVAPMLPLFCEPPTAIMVASLLRAILMPKRVGGDASLGTISVPCWLHEPLERYEKPHAAPTVPSFDPPATKILPSWLIAVDIPN